MHRSPRKITIHYQETMPLSPQFEVLSPKTNKHISTENSLSTRATSPQPIHKTVSVSSKERTAQKKDSEEYE